MFGERKLYGIPYFGTKTDEIYHTALEKEVKEYREVEYDSMYEFIQKEVTKDKLVIIESDNERYLTYLRDIRFNYRDKEILLPYFRYDKYITDKTYKRKNSHILLTEDNKIIVRHNYNLCKYILSSGTGEDDKLENNMWSLLVFENGEHIRINIKHKFYNNDTFNMEELYRRYLASCYMQEDFYLNSHVEGYHIINKNIRGITNKERNLRKEFKLNDIIESSIDLNYRDVRQYREEDILIKKGLIENQDNYWKRILEFESLLYCIMRDDVIPDNLELKSEWLKLGVSKNIYKYGEDIKLIFKSYWKNSYKQIETKSWSRVME